MSDPLRPGASPTNETPAGTIEIPARSAHDDDMDTTVELVERTLSDPVVIASTVAVSAAFLTGAAARAIEFTERRSWHRGRRSGTVRTG